MKKLGIFIMFIMGMTFMGCERVAPNYQGVLMENWGQQGKKDFSLHKGRVWTLTPGTELFQVPLWEQRADFGDDILHLKASDNTEFTVKPRYSYKAMEDRAIDIVFDNKQLGSGDKFMRSLEDNILEPKIYDVMKEESRKFSTDKLMSDGGSLQFEEKIQDILEEVFKNKGLQLMTFSCQVDFSEKVKEKIDSRNEVNTNIGVLDQQIEEQKKRNILAALKAEENKLLSSGITEKILTQQFIEKWDGHTPLYGNVPLTIFKEQK